jgi:hypothetical protein
MLGLLLVYFIGKYYYQLAFHHNRNAWGYAILGVIVYYGTTFLSGFLFAFTYLEMGNESIDSGTELLLSILSIPVGILGAYILYKALEKSWKSSNSDSLNSDILDQDMS